MSVEVPSLSVIVPVHNGEEYLPECLDSLLAQTHDDFELILVDDASSEAARIVIDEYRKADSRIRVIRFERNVGAGVARNAGLADARGEYVYCFDSDDYCDKGLFESALACARRYDADVVAVPFYLYNQQVGVPLYAEWGLRRDRYPDGSFSWRDNPNALLETFHNYPWNKFVRRAFLERNGIAFQEIFLTEDLMYSGPVLVLADRIACIESPYVYHREGTGSNLMSSKHRHPFDFIDAFSTFRSFLIDRGCMDELFCAYTRWAANACVYNLMTMGVQQSFEDVFERLRVGGLDEMGLTAESLPCIEDGFAKFLLECVRSGDMEGLLFVSSRDARSASDLMGYKAAVEFQINEGERRRIRDLQSEVAEFDRRWAEMHRELERQSEELAIVTHERDEIERIHREIMGAAEQKVGQAICYIPRLIQRRMLAGREESTR